MSYKRFPNARELYRADLNTKLNDGLVSEEFRKRDCNCAGSNLREGACMYGGDCRSRCQIYKVTCRHCDKFYIGNTSDLLKNRTAGHCSDTCSLANKSPHPRSTELSKHCHMHLGISHPDGPPYRSGRFTTPLVKSMLDVEILWSCNGIRACKSFGKRECLLCNQERLYIMKTMKSKEGANLLNAKLKIGTGCPHKARFHLFGWE